MEDLSQYNPEGSILRQAQHRMLYILKEVDAICRRHGIQYFLDGGSLIGAVRHHGFIPWDDDLDIAIMLNDYKLLKHYLQTELPADLVFQDRWTDFNYPSLIAKVRDKNSFFEEIDIPLVKERGIFIDIIPMERVTSLKWKSTIDYLFGHCIRAIHNYTSPKDKLLSLFVFPFAWLLMVFTRLYDRLSFTHQIAHRYGWKAYGGFKYEDTFPVQDLIFENLKVMAPANPDAVLKELFGDYMQIPPKEKRPQHAGKIEIYK